MEEKQIREQLDKKITLNNGYGIPKLGYGTWQTPDGETAKKAVIDAVQVGYRHIDTAAVYGNEVSVGAGIAACGVDRKELFITSKVWCPNWGYEKTLAAFDKTMSDLKLEYLDMYLIHWPAASNLQNNWEEINLDTWRAMEKLYKEGRIKAIGLSNFLPHHMKTILENGEIMPAVDQIESHPGYYQKEVIDFCRKNNVLVEGWSPLGSGAVLQNEFLKTMADKYGRSVAQICLRWNLQHDVLALPKSLNPARMLQNADIYDFEISEEDMQKIDEMPQTGFSGNYPDTFTF